MRTPEEDKRNKEIFDNPDLACYVFRGYVVLYFDKAAAKEGRRDALLHFGADANSCRFIPEDYTIMATFLQRCRDFIDGKIDDVESVRVA